MDRSRRLLGGETSRRVPGGRLFISADPTRSRLRHPPQVRIRFGKPSGRPDLVEPAGRLVARQQSGGAERRLNIAEVERLNCSGAARV